MARARFSISEFCCLISLMKFMKTLSSWGISLGSVRLRFWYSVAACSFLKDKQLFLAQEDWSAPSALWQSDALEVQGEETVRSFSCSAGFFCSINFFLLDWTIKDRNQRASTLVKTRTKGLWFKKLTQWCYAMHECVPPCACVCLPFDRTNRLSKARANTHHWLSTADVMYCLAPAGYDGGHSSKK